MLTATREQASRNLLGSWPLDCSPGRQRALAKGTTMKALCTAAAIIVTVCAVSAGAIADETTTTTTTTHERPGPSGPPGIVVGVPGVVGVEVGGLLEGMAVPRGVPPLQTTTREPPDQQPIRVVSFQTFPPLGLRLSRRSPFCLRHCGRVKQNFAAFPSMPPGVVLVRIATNASQREH